MSQSGQLATIEDDSGGSSRSNEQRAVERAVERAVDRKLGDDADGGTVERVLAGQIEDALRAEEYQKAALLVDEYKALQSESQSLLDQVEVDEGAVDLPTALALQGSRALASDGTTARNVGRNIAEMKRGFEEADETVDEVRETVGGLRGLADLEAEMEAAQQRQRQQRSEPDRSEEDSGTDYVGPTSFEDFDADAEPEPDAKPEPAVEEVDAGAEAVADGGEPEPDAEDDDEEDDGDPEVRADGSGRVDLADAAEGLDIVVDDPAAVEKLASRLQSEFSRRQLRTLANRPGNILSNEMEEAGQMMKDIWEIRSVTGPRARYEFISNLSELILDRRRQARMRRRQRRPDGGRTASAPLLDGLTPMQVLIGVLVGVLLLTGGGKRGGARDR